MNTATRRVLALAATVSLTAAACGSDSNDAETVDTDSDTATTEAMADEPMDTEPMDTEPMDTEPMDTEPMDEGADTTEMSETTEAPGTTEAMDDSMEEDGEMAAPATDDGASELRAGLTSLLQEHVYLAGITIETAVDAGGDVEAPPVQAASAALDENSVALADAVGSVAGDENREAFLGLWREHIGFFVDYTLGVAGGDQAAIDQALADLDGYQDAAGAFFEEITAGGVTADEVIAGLDEHVATLTTAIDGVVAGDAAAFDDLRAAAQHMFGAALLLSGGITTAVPDQFPGDVMSAPAETRATLTNLLQEHVYLAGIAIEQAVEAGGDVEAPAAAAAVATLDTNSVALADVVGSVAGDENREAFLGLWREHIGFFVDYTLGVAGGDQAAIDQALADLDGYQDAAGAFFEEITAGAVTADEVIAGLDEHVATLTTAIDGVVAGDAAAFSDLRAAAQHMPTAALLLSTAIVEATSGASEGSMDDESMTEDTMAEESMDEESMTEDTMTEDTMEDDSEG